jgi:hypothetical protein
MCPRSPADDIKQQLGSRFGERDVAQFVQQDQVLPVQLFLQTLQRSFLSRFQQLGHQARRGVKAHPLALATRGKAQRCGQMSEASTSSGVLMVVNLFRSTLK